MTPIPIPFGSRAYQHRSLPVSVQNIINYYPEIQGQDSNSTLTLHPRFGLLLNCTAGNGPIRGLHDFLGTLYAVSGDALYSISASGVVTLKATGISGSGYVSMANNITQLAIATGSSGFVWNGTSLVQITDTDFQGANTCVFQHQRIIWDGAGGNFQLSKLNDATAYVAIDIADAEAVPDDTIAVKTKGDELWLFGEKSIELWSDIGGTGFPYQRSPGAVIDIGLGAKHSVVLLQNAMYFLGSDYQVYRAYDLNAQPVSTPVIADYIDSLPVKDDCQGMGYVIGGQYFVDFNFRQSQRTLTYGVSSGLWSEKSSYNTNFADNRAAFRAQGHAFCYGRNYVGDFENGNIYKMDLNTYTDNGTTIVREVTSPPSTANGLEMFFSKLFLDMETGRGLPSGQGSSPIGYLSWSDDGGRNFSTDLAGDLGTIANYIRLEWSRLGSAQTSRSWRFRTSEPIPGSISKAYLEYEVGR